MVVAVSASKDATRVVALVVAVESLAKGENQSLGDLAGSIFGWSPERVFLAIDAAIESGQIAKNATTGAIEGKS
jgi:hypothetical protein